LLALGRPGTVLPIRHATRAIWPDQTGPLTASQMASAVRSITRLVNHGLAKRRGAGVAVTPAVVPIVLSEQMARLSQRSSDNTRAG
jgi:hypothetical protein